jgi:general secretion pathway protein K
VSRRRREAGIALITVLLIVMLLAAVVAGFAYSAHVDRRVAENYRDELRARHALDAVEAQTRMLLSRDAAENAIDSLQDGWAGELPELPLDGVEVEARITDDSARFNVNGLVRPDGKPDPVARDELLRLTALLGGPETAAEVTTDWIDPDQDGLYESGAANRELVSVYELGAVRGLDRSFLYGRTGPGESRQGLLDFVTVHTEVPVNINTASLEVLEAVTGEAGIARDILAARRERPFEKLSELRGLSPAARASFPRLERRLTVASSVFRMEARAACGPITASRTTVFRRNGKGIEVLIRVPACRLDGSTVEGSR